eukprot:Nitzschia sp. Nitz4//scaffold42_size132992//97085//99309//NITZ4_003413-RA/size132992-augustus-gene-0.118-mRNA-1//-1//CDS//3329551760//174//frame0
MGPLPVPLRNVVIPTRQRQPSSSATSSSAVAKLLRSGEGTKRRRKLQLIQRDSMVMQKVDQRDDIGINIGSNKGNAASDHVVDDASSTDSKQSDTAEAVVVVEPSPPVADDIAIESNKEEDIGGATSKKRKQRPMKKDPRAPKRFRSSYIFFSQDRFPEIREELKSEGIQMETVHITKMVSEEWKNLGKEERVRYEEMSRKDKERFEVEKKMYKGTWHVPTTQKLTKDDTAPKRPASAFLMFSNPRRAALKKERTDLSNGDISKLLSQMWKDATPAERKPYEDEEVKRRNQYKEKVAVWREEQEALLQKRQNKAMKMAEKGEYSSDIPTKESAEEEVVVNGRRTRRADARNKKGAPPNPEVVYSSSATNTSGLPYMIDSRIAALFPPPSSAARFPGSAPSFAGASWGTMRASDFAPAGYPAGAGDEGTILQRVHGAGPRYLLQRPSPYFTYEQDVSLVHLSHRAAAMAAGALTSAAGESDPSLLYAASGLAGMAGLSAHGAPGPAGSSSTAAAAAFGGSAAPPIAFVNENGIPMMLRAVPIPMGAAVGTAGAPEFAGSWPPSGVARRFPPGASTAGGGFIPPPGFGTVIGGREAGAPQPPMEAFRPMIMMGQRQEGEEGGLRQHEDSEASKRMTTRATPAPPGASNKKSKKAKKEAPPGS